MLLENQVAKEVPGTSKVAGNLILELVPPSLLIQIVIIKCQMSWLRGFSSLSGSLSTVVYLPVSPLHFSWVMVSWKEAKGMAKGIILEKKILFLRTIFFVVVEELKYFCFLFYGQQCRTTEGCCGESLCSA